jgi:hypothetical protein
MQVKAPVTRAGLQAIEEATYQGVSVNATVSFTVPQALAVAEAVERGLNRRSASGLPIEQMSPVCTIMVGRTDDWVKVLAKREKIDIDPRLPGLGWDRLYEESLPYLPAARLPCPPWWQRHTATWAIYLSSWAVT